MANERTFEFSSRNSKVKLPYFSSPHAEQVNKSLEIPSHKQMQRLEARQYISTYEADVTRIATLLELPKLDFNLLQKLHQRELSDISRWWKEIDFGSKLPLARDRWELFATKYLPEYMQVCYLALLDVLREIKEKLENEA